MNESYHAGPIFLTTRWSVVLAAQDKSSPQSADALQTLCQAYWYPLYAYVRRSGRSPHDSQDLTQEFFARLLAQDWLRVVLPEKGRFRTFLLVALKRFLANEWHRAVTQKRGAGQATLPLDTLHAEHRYASEPALAADQVYERRWAMTLLEQTLQTLGAEFGGPGKFETLKKWLTADRGEIPYAEVAAELGTSQANARVAVHRLRKRFRQLFRDNIAQTVAATEDVDSELRYLVSVLTRG